MTRIRAISALALVWSLLLSLTVVGPAPTLAADLTVTTCTRDGLAAVIAAAATTDPSNPGTVTFNCPSPTISFTSNIPIGGGATAAVIIDGSNNGNQIILDGIEGDGINTNFFQINANGHLTLKNVTMQHGSNAQGGAVKVEDGGVASISHSTFSNNVATDKGGAIWASGSITVAESSFSKNHANDDGGAIYAAWRGPYSILNSEFTENTAGSNGGALYNYIGTLNVAGSTFTKNQAHSSGAINNGYILNVSQSSFTENYAEVAGGAISSGTQGRPFISESSFNGNHADAYGGALYFSGPFTVYRNTFINNYSNQSGGAIQTAYGGGRIVASTFSGNTTVQSGSAIASLVNAQTTIAWSTIIQPDGEDQAALDVRGPVSLVGVILGGYGNHCNISGAGSLTDSYTLANDTSCSLDGDQSQQDLDDLGLGAIKTATLNGVEHSYYPPLDTSPALTIGPAICDTDIIPGSDLDQLGNARPFGATCTIGAIEVDNLPPVFDNGGSTSTTTINEGETVTLNFAATDADSDSDDLTYACDPGDGSVPSFSSEVAVVCSYPDNGTFSARVLVSDGMATTASIAVEITVNNLAPTITSVTVDPTLVVINQPVTIQIAAADVPADTVNLSYDCGNTFTGTTTPVGSTTGSFGITATCQYPQPGTFTISGTVVDDDSGTSDPFSRSIRAVTPTTLCAERWTGSLRASDTCDRSETQIALPYDGPITLCVNQWNGATRVATSCSRSEQPVTAIGDNTISICINTWNNTLRSSSTCTRSEHQAWL